MTNSLVDRWNRGCDSLLLLQEADQTITQLHAAVKTAQELAATRLMDVGRLTRERHEYKIWWERDSKSLGTALNDLSLERACKQDLQAQLRQVVAIGFEAGVEAQRRSHEPLEQPVATPGATPTGEDSVRQPAESSRPRELLSQGASRDASSAWDCTCNDPSCAYCGPRLSQRTNPADLVGALQDMVHTDPGPVRAGSSKREWNFDRYRGGKLMAQGVKVHAPNYADAYEKAMTMLFTDGNKPTDELRLSERTNDGL